MKYSSELTRAYSNKREKYNETDELFFNELNEVGFVDKNVLDLGCGDGRHANIIAKSGASSVLGVDINEKMIELAESKHGSLPNLEFKVASGDNIPSADHSIDVVVSNFVLHYFNKFNEVFDEISRILKNDGYFIGTFNITDVEEGSEYLYNKTMPIKLGRGKDAIIVENLIKSREELESALEKAGFTILKEIELDHPNAIVDPDFEHADKIKKHAIIFTLKKVITSSTNLH